MIQKQTKKEIIEWQEIRTVKYPPKRGRLKRSEVKRAVEKVIYARLGGGEAEQTRQPKRG